MRFEAEKQLEQRIGVLESMNKELCDQISQLEQRNGMLNDQITALDLQLHVVGGKITSAENKMLIAYEEKRKAVTDLRILKRLNDNLESSIESHEREKDALLLELQRFSKQKMRSNHVEAELYRKKKMYQLDKRTVQAAAKMMASVESHVAV